VETAQQLETLRELGCDQFQGFYRSAAVPPADILTCLPLAGVVTEPLDQQMIMATQSKLAIFKPA
jgi:EAL domain-containing protein (putative c-di-GMP-specific phosphodiesterase class I)